MSTRHHPGIHQPIRVEHRPFQCSAGVRANSPRIFRSSWSSLQDSPRDRTGHLYVSLRKDPVLIPAPLVILLPRLLTLLIPFAIINHIAANIVVRSTLLRQVSRKSFGRLLCKERRLPGDEDPHCSSHRPLHPWSNSCMLLLLRRRFAAIPKSVRS